MKQLDTVFDTVSSFVFAMRAQPFFKINQNATGIQNICKNKRISTVYCSIRI